MQVYLYHKQYFSIAPIIRFAVSGKVGTLSTLFNHTSCMTVVTPSDRPKSVRNCCLIEVFGRVFVVHWFSNFLLV